MSESKVEGQYSLEKIELRISISIAVAILLIALVLGSYFFKFHGVLDAEQSNWGTFGDFDGGTLNPVLAALGFYWLTSSIRIQLQELRETRKVLEKTANHQESIASLESKNVETQQEILALQKESLLSQIKSVKDQQDQIAIQNFENMFFELLKTKNTIIEDVLHTQSTIPLPQNDFKGISTKLSGKEAINESIVAFKYAELDWISYYENNLINYLGTYFRVCYQIVRLIDRNEALKKTEGELFTPYSYKQKQYFDIFKATLQQAELEALFFNCLAGYDKFKKIMEKYSAFDPLLSDAYSVDLNKYVTQFAYLYDRQAFGNNR